MKKISIWASRHIIASRIIIVVSWIVLMLIGVYTGSQLIILNVRFPSITMIFFITFFLVAFLVYPSRNNKKKKITISKFYLHQKSCDFILAFSSFCMIVYCSNHSDRLFQSNNGVHATAFVTIVHPKDSTRKPYKSISAFASSMKEANGNPLKWKERKKLLNEQVKAIKKAAEPSKGEKTILIILSVLVALLLLSLIAALACSIACSGSGVVAALIMAGGTALVVFLLIGMIKRITGKKRKTIEEL